MASFKNQLVLLVLAIGICSLDEALFLDVGQFGKAEGLERGRERRMILLGQLGEHSWILKAWFQREGTFLEGGADISLGVFQTISNRPKYLMEPTPLAPSLPITLNDTPRFVNRLCRLSVIIRRSEPNKIPIQGYIVLISMVG